MKTICVRHRDGWCATRRRKVPGVDGGSDNQRTVCQHYVVLPWGYAEREPTCAECRAKLALLRVSADDLADLGNVLTEVGKMKERDDAERERLGLEVDIA